MSLKTKVKIGNITSLSVARYCAGMGVDFLGFPLWNFEEDLKKFSEIAAWVAGPQFVVECYQPEAVNWVLREKVDVEFLQVELIDLASLKIANYKLFVLLPEAINPPLIETLLKEKNQIEYVVASSNGFEKNKQLLRDFKTLILDEEPESKLDEILSKAIDGLALEGNNEIKPGIQDYQRLSSILERLEMSEE